MKLPDSKYLFLLLLIICFPIGSVGQSRVTSCSACAEWNLPQKPFRIFGNTYYVGTHGLSAILITSESGHILIDGDLAESAEQIVSNIRTLGFRIEDVRIILNSHVHFDHAGGMAELQKMSGARVLASPWSAAVLRNGRPGRGDPQYRTARRIAPLRHVHDLRDGERVTVGQIVATARFTPGHTPGGTSWTWRSCEGSICHDIVYADSLTPVSDNGFRFSNSREYPQALRDFDKSFAFLETTLCDILITTHPEASGLWDRLEGRQSGTSDSMVSTGACKNLAAQGRASFRQRLAKERKPQSGSNE